MLTQALEEEALRRDAEDPLRKWRAEFHIPRTADGREGAYFCGNSLGLQPRGVKAAVEQELRDWEELGVHGHFRARTPWYSYHEVFRDSAASVVGAKPGEVVMMNSLTVNLHLMMASFYRPAGRRRRILVDGPIFPSDLYAVQSQALFHGHEDAVLIVDDPDAVEAALGDDIALVLLGGVNFFTGHWIDMPRMVRAAHAAGCVIGFDLAHAAGNVPMSLHDWDVDFAVWCTYKYLNSGPGAVGGCFVHERHSAAPRLAGWWGNDPRTRFDMPDAFVPHHGAEGWQMSNAPVMSMAPSRVSHDIFHQVGMPALRAKSLQLTQFLWDNLPGGSIEVLTPADPDRRGCQLSLRCADAELVLRRLEAEGIVCDLRRPDVLRVAPVPLYNTFHDVWRLVAALSRITEE